MDHLLTPIGVITGDVFNHLTKQRHVGMRRYHAFSVTALLSICLSFYFVCTTNLFMSSFGDRLFVTVVGLRERKHLVDESLLEAI